MSSGLHSRALSMLVRLSPTTDCWIFELNANELTFTWSRSKAARVAAMLRAMYFCSLANSLGFTLKFCTAAG